MGLFGTDKEQDARLDTLESHIRVISEALQQNQLDVSSLRITLIGLQAQMDEKMSADDFDPGIVVLNEQLAVARKEFDKLSSAATDSWSTLHAGATEALSTLRNSVEVAASQIGEQIGR